MIRALPFFLLATLGAPGAAAAQNAVRVYFGAQESSSASRAVYSANLDGSDRTTLFTGTTTLGMDVNPFANTLYVMNADAGRIDVCSTSAGGSCNSAISLGGSAGAIRMDLANRYVYWTDFIENAIRRAALTTLVAEDVITLERVWGLALDVEGDRLFWTTGSGNEGVWQARLDGSQPTLLLFSSQVSDGRGITYDPVSDMVFITDASRNEILAVDPSDGTTATVIVSNVEGAEMSWAIDIDVAGRRIYWTGRQGVWSARVDGTDIQRVHFVDRPSGDTGFFSGIALERDIAALGAPCASDDQCLSTHCVDNVCCEGECDGMCFSCASADTGLPDGECHAGIAGVARDPLCEDLEACTDNFCAESGCMAVPVTGSCDDGDACTMGDVCSAGVCMPGPDLCDAGTDAGALDAGPTSDSGPMNADSGSDAATPSGDSGSMGGDASPDAGPDGASAGCGCATFAPSTSGSPALLLFGALIFAHRRRARA